MVELRSRLENAGIGRIYCAELGAFGFNGNYCFVVVLDGVLLCICFVWSGEIGEYKSGIEREESGFSVKGGVVV